MFELALAFEPCVERLADISVAVPIRFQQPAATFCQHNRLFAITRDANRLDEPLFSEMAEVAITHIAGSFVMVAEVAGGHDAKGTDGCQRSALRATQGVFPIARIVDHVAVTTARQIEATGKHLTRIGATVPRIAIAPRPSGILAIPMVRAVTCVVPIVVACTLVMVFGRRTRATSERQPVVIVIPIALVAIAVARVPLVAVVARIEVHHTSADLDATVLASDAGLRRMCA